MGISSVEGFDRDAKFICEKGMTLLLLIKSEGLEQIVN
jgi:hypothetical protein